MKPFVKKILFLLSILLLFSAIFVSIAYLFKSRLINYEIPKDKHVVFMGNSQFEMGINDADFEGVINCGKSAKLYMMMAIDLENLIKNNPQIDTVILTVSQFTIRKNASDGDYYNETYMRSITYYTPYLTVDDWRILPTRTIFASSLLFGECLKYLAMPQKCGGYIYNTRDDLKEHVIKQKKLNQETTSGDLPGEQITISQLKRISRLCKDNSICLILMSAPTYHAAQFYGIREFQDRVQYVKKMMRADDYWDYFELALPDSCFSDITHLNGKGATQFTKVLKKRMGRDQ